MLTAVAKLSVWPLGILCLSRLDEVPKTNLYECCKCSEVPLEMNSIVVTPTVPAFMVIRYASPVQFTSMFFSRYALSAHNPPPPKHPHLFFPAWLLWKNFETRF